MAETAWTIKAIKPRKLNIAAVRMEILNALRAEGTVQRNLLKQTVATWEGDKPEFETLIGLDSGNASVMTGPVGSMLGVKKWNWLNEGTRVRRAVMSRDWRSKTSPRSYRSGAGRGRVVFISRKISMPGIKAREWSRMVQEQRRRPFTTSMMAAMRRGLAKRQ
jgi:hypothetical protein